MPLKNSGLGELDTPRKTQSRRKPGTVRLVLGILLAVLLLDAAFSLIGKGAGGAARLFVVLVLLVAVVCAVGAALGAAKKRRGTGEEMHADHYRRTRQERPHGSADPCAYSEYHSWRKSQAYDDPWDF